MKVGINGFGRIGRSILRALIDQDFPFDLAVINELGDIHTTAHLLKYDSVHGRLKADVRVDKDSILVGSKKIKITSHRNPAEIPWQQEGVGLVLECTGLFTAREKASLHLQGGAKKVLISAPAENPDITVAFGINMDAYKPKEHAIISNASCTTNCLAPVAKIIHETFGIQRGLVTTIHSYTNDQRILDVAHSDLRRARAAAVSQIPTKTGAAKAVGLVLPELAGKIDGMAVRVPTPNVSCVDLVCDVAKDASVESVNEALKKAAETNLKGVMGYTEEPLVSCDFNGDSHSAVIDALSTKVIDKKMIKVLAWYDNETGFSHRMVDVAKVLLKDL